MGAEQWQATFDAITDAVCIVDANGIVRQCNAAADAIFGRSKGVPADVPFSDIFPLPRNASREMIRDALTTGRPLRYDAHRNDRWLSIRLDPVPPRGDVEPSVVAVIADVTE